MISRNYAAVFVAAAFTGLLAPPVSVGKAAAPQVAVFLSDVLVATDSAGTLSSVLAGASEQVELENFVLKVDFSGLAGVATVTPVPADDCEVAGSVVSCDLGVVVLDGVARLEPSFAVVPAAGASVGATGKWKATISADGLAPTSVESSVTLAEGVDLGVPEESISVTGSPGGTIPIPLQVDNVGEKAADGAVALVLTDYPVVTAKQYSNCTFRDGHLTSCTFDERLEAGLGYTTSEPVSFKLRPDTFAPSRTSLQVHWLTKAEFELAKKTFQPDFLGSPGTGDPLRLNQNQSLSKASPQTDIRDTNNTAFVTVTVEGDNGADLAAVGGSASGAVGQVVTLNLGLHNAGPATIDFIRSDESAGVFDVTLPPGSSLAEMPARCVAMRLVDGRPQTDPDAGNLLARLIRCSNKSRLLPVNTGWTVPVKLHVDQAITDATGAVSLPAECSSFCRPDKNPANDTAAVVLNAASLPKTGVQTGLIAGTGALLALAGAAVLLLSRRRRLKAPEPD